MTSRVHAIPGGRSLRVDFWQAVGKGGSMVENLDRERIASAAARLPNGERFLNAIETIDRLNVADPNRITVGGIEVSYELHFSRLLFEKALQLREYASEALLIAARSQHICRWELPRGDYPEGRAGYLRWRADLKRFHADRTAEILSDLGYDADTIQSVRSINLKQDLKSNPECQTMEDALCLVFLEFQFPDFRLKTDDEKMVSILRKTWAKMSDEGRKAVLELKLGKEEARLVGLALEE